MSATKKYFIVYFSLLSLLSLAAFTAQSLDDNDVEDESEEGESNPLLDLASGFLQNSLAGKGDGGGLAAIGGMLGTLMQGNGAKNLGDALAGMQGKRNNPTGDVLSSLGSLFTNNEGNLDPSLLGSVISAFAGSVGGNEEEEVIKPVKKTQLKQQQQKQKKKQQKPQEGLDLSAILNVASAFMGNMGQNKKKSGSGPTGNVMEDLAGALPLIMSTISSFTGPEAEERAHKHADHAWFLPPLVEKLHVFWDHFISSDLGKTVWQNAGLSELTKTFTDENGRIDFEVILKSLENHSFRRRWIKRATTYLAEWATHVANPEVQQRYLASSQFVVNGFLSSQGFPKHIVFNPAKFSESTSTIVNYVLKKYLNHPTDVSVYIKPAVKYFNDILQTAQSHGSYLRTANKHELSDKLTDTLNLEIIEPVLRVYRAYRFAHKAPHCQTHVLCVINRHDPDEKLGLPGFKAGLTKFSSLVASAALSYQGGHGFWDLYNAIQDDSNCQARYPAVCDEFHEEEVNVTTEYYHNEL